MFPEGTDRTAFTLGRSREYAQKNDLPELHNVLYPRSAGKRRRLIRERIRAACPTD